MQSTTPTIGDQFETTFVTRGNLSLDLIHTLEDGRTNVRSDVGNMVKRHIVSRSLCINPNPLLQGLSFHINPIPLFFERWIRNCTCIVFFSCLTCSILINSDNQQAIAVAKRGTIGAF